MRANYRTDRVPLEIAALSSLQIAFFDEVPILPQIHSKNKNFDRKIHKLKIILVEVVVVLLYAVVVDSSVVEVY